MVSVPSIQEVLKNPPIKPPWIARHVWSVTAWCSILTFVAFYPVYKAYGWFFLLLHARLAFIQQDPPFILVIMTSFAICAFPPIIWGGGVGSKYLRKLVHFYLESGDRDIAVQLANYLAAKLWFRDFKKDAILRQLVIESGLGDRNERYKKMLVRLGSR